ncbi:hypothetical protein BKA70DRAFT_1370410 [Coprinopsis sp. MPI-PUGE-AT-0042]|nr:hypothetical protein BKA70DRAFT_1370410 [Coprinopsis sp. MPI-PUGE-AT-0042]
MPKRGTSNRYECGPDDPVETFSAKLKHKKGKKSAKVELVPESLRTPKTNRAGHPGSTGSKRHKVAHINVAGSDHPVLDGNGEWEHDPDLYVPFTLPEPNVNHRNSPNDYMREWSANKQKEYLSEVVEKEALPVLRSCSCCQTELEGSTIWRCKDCFGQPIFCTSCCRNQHASTPFHRVEIWHSTHFRQSWLWRTGLKVSLCKSTRCNEASPSGAASSTFPPSTPPEDDPTFGAKPEGRVFGDSRSLVVVHTNGIHHVVTQFCQCDDAPEDDIQLLRMGLYPSTHRDVRTAFTFELLDYYLLDTLECYTSSLHFYTKIRRVTNEVFPKSAPDRYREGLRCGRQWRRLKELKRNGCSHSNVSKTEGSMALFCAACPQDGKNLKPGWRNDPEQWKYTVSLVADGNFSLIHRATQTSKDDVWLKSGESFMVEKDRYAAHIASSKEPKQKPTCNEHRAIEDRYKVHNKGCDVTGVGAFACSRHGAFVPSSVVDFQKGERQMNMDYGYHGAIRASGADKAPRTVLLYDVNCQYSVHLQKRFNDAEYLELPSGFQFTAGIGQFHVHGHQEKCYARYSPLFIDGLGRTSGEILESLWSVLNEAARSTQVMSLAHRSEVLDALIADSNWKKMTGLLRSIPRGYSKSFHEFKKSQESFDLLNATTSDAQREAWKAQLAEALAARAEDVSAMDIFNISIQKPPSRSKVQHDLMQEEQSKNHGLGVTSWIGSGFKIQEAQLQLKAFLRSLPRIQLRTELQELETVRKREQLQSEISTFCEIARQLFPQVSFNDYVCFPPPTADPEIDGEDEDDLLAHSFDDSNPFIAVDSTIQPESVEIPLPSSFKHIPDSMKQARSKEIKMRIAQANDSLEAVRVEIGHKSYLYRSNIRLAEGKKQKTRGYDAVKAADNSMRHMLRLYSQARWALVNLNADRSVLKRFREVTRADTAAITAVYKPNARGESNKALSWIWTVDIKGDSDKSSYLQELYRINWLRAKCQAARWQEEFCLLRCEMDWVKGFFENQAQYKGPGHIAYAYRQSAMWKLLRSQASSAFQKAINDVEVAQAQYDAHRISTA